MSDEEKKQAEHPASITGTRVYDTFGTPVGTVGHFPRGNPVLLDTAYPTW